MGVGQWGGGCKTPQTPDQSLAAVWKWSHLIHLMGNVRGKFLSSIPLTPLAHAHTALLTTGNPALNYHSSQSSSCSSDPAFLQAGLLWGLCFLRQEGWIWPRAEADPGAFRSSQHLSPVRALDCHCSSTERIFKCLDPTHKHTSSEGNEAEHYVMHIQELKQSLGISSKFYSVFSVFLRHPQYSLSLLICINAICLNNPAAVGEESTSPLNNV